MSLIDSFRALLADEGYSTAMQRAEEMRDALELIMEASSGTEKGCAKLLLLRTTEVIEMLLSVQAQRTLLYRDEDGAQL